jgi:RNA recognition motif-containing protein
LHKTNLIIDNKKVILQQCDSNRVKNKKFIQVVYLKNLTFKASEADVIKYFSPKAITKILIPRDESNKPKGFGYVEF